MDERYRVWGPGTRPDCFYDKQLILQICLDESHRRKYLYHGVVGKRQEKYAAAGTP
jgi:hypothetical protein